MVKEWGGPTACPNEPTCGAASTHAIAAVGSIQSFFYPPTSLSPAHRVDQLPGTSPARYVRSGKPFPFEYACPPSLQSQTGFPTFTPPFQPLVFALDYPPPAAYPPPGASMGERSKDKKRKRAEEGSSRPKKKNSSQNAAPAPAPTQPQALASTPSAPIKVASVRTDNSCPPIIGMQMLDFSVPHSSSTRLHILVPTR